MIQIKKNNYKFFINYALYLTFNIISLYNKSNLPYSQKEIIKLLNLLKFDKILVIMRIKKNTFSIR